MSKLTYINNWERDEYRVDDLLVTSLREVEIEGARYKVKTKEVSVPYNDMGHEYEGVSDHYFIRATVFGKVMEFDLRHLVKNVEIIPVKYTTEK